MINIVTLAVYKMYVLPFPKYSQFSIKFPSPFIQSPIYDLSLATIHMLQTDEQATNCTNSSTVTVRLLK